MVKQPLQIIRYLVPYYGTRWLCWLQATGDNDYPSSNKRDNTNCNAHKLYFAYLVEFPGCKEIIQFSQIKNYELPKNIRFTGNFYQLKNLDYPYNNVQWPLMSSAMLEVLENLGEFSSRKIPITMLDDTVDSKELYLASGEPNPEHALKRFIVIQLLEHLDAFDWIQSVYEHSEYVPGRVEFIDKLVLKPIPGGYPPIFRVSACPTLLFISAEARIALEKSGVTGVHFTELSDYPIERS